MLESARLQTRDEPVAVASSVPISNWSVQRSAGLELRSPTPSTLSRFVRDRRRLQEGTVRVTRSRRAPRAGSASLGSPDKTAVREFRKLRLATVINWDG